MKAKVLLVEDQKMFLQLLEGILRSMPGLEVVATCQTANEGIELCQRHLPDLLVLDLQLPDGNGVAVARQLMVSKPDAKIIVLSGHANTFICPPDLQPAMHAIIDKTRAYSALQEQIHLLLDTRGIKRTKSDVSKLEQLTEREQEIFEMIGRGRTNRQIAEHFGLSEHTVKTHRKRIANKLNLRGAALIHKATLATRRAVPQLA
jgi:DNA-binding NarL/FixJ family response regulator